MGSNIIFNTSEELRKMIKEERERGERPRFVNDMLDREVLK